MYFVVILCIFLFN